MRLFVDGDSDSGSNLALASGTATPSNTTTLLDSLLLLLKDPLVLVVAQPTRGLDVGAIETVHAYLRDAAAKGVGILLMSEDLDELRALSDRILVVYEGAVVGELAAGKASNEEIGYLMAGGQR